MISKTSLAAVISCVALPLFLSILLNLAESAAVYLNDTKLKFLVSSGNVKAQRIERLLRRHSAFRLSVQFVSGLCLYYTVSYLYLYFSSHLASYLDSPLLYGLVSFVLTFLFGLLFLAVAIHAPRRVAGFFPNVALTLSWLLSLVAFLTFPFTAVVEAVAALIVRITGNDPNSDPNAVTEEEIRMLVDEGNERGAIEEAEKEMINNIFEFDDRDVSQVMTHRTELCAVELHASLDEVAGIAMESGYSRLPVYDEDIDSICGIIYAKDLIKYIHQPEKFHLADEMRNPLYVPESSSCSDVFALLKREKVQIAIVVDEYGGTYGIVTMEDLLESIVGNIQDEYDNEESMATKIEDGVYILDGSMGISDAERLLNFHVPDTSEADTLGGFLFELIGGVPYGELAVRSATYGDVAFTVLVSDERRIEQIKAELKPVQD